MGDTSVIRTVHASPITVSVALLGVGHVAAHHSFAAEFDPQKPVTLKGSVVKWEMINPHGWTCTWPFHIGRATRRPKILPARLARFLSISGSVHSPRSCLDATL